MSRYLSIFILLVAGCSAQHIGGDTAGKRPGVSLKKSLFRGIEIELTSDGSFSMDNFTISKQGDNITLHITKINIDQQPSKTIIEEVTKLRDGIGKLQEEQTKQQAQITSMMSNMTNAIVGIFSPWQSFLMKGAGEALVEYTKRPTVTTTQPVSTTQPK
jgi:hypothetical protein